MSRCSVYFGAAAPDGVSSSCAIYEAYRYARSKAQGLLNVTVHPRLAMVSAKPRGLICRSAAQALAVHMCPPQQAPQLVASSWVLCLTADQLPYTARCSVWQSLPTHQIAQASCTARQCLLVQAPDDIQQSFLDLHIKQGVTSWARPLLIEAGMDTSQVVHAAGSQCQSIHIEGSMVTPHSSLARLCNKACSGS